MLGSPFHPRLPVLALGRSLLRNEGLFEVLLNIFEFVFLALVRLVDLPRLVEIRGHSESFQRARRQSLLAELVKKGVVY